MNKRIKLVLIFFLVIGVGYATTQVSEIPMRGKVVGTQSACLYTNAADCEKRSLHITGGYKGFPVAYKRILVINNNNTTIATATWHGISLKWLNIIIYSAVYGLILTVILMIKANRNAYNRH